MIDLLRREMSPAPPVKGGCVERNAEDREARIRAQAERIEAEMRQMGLVYGTMREEQR